MSSIAPQSLFPTTRLEAFSDGVIAVIITIMVLEMKVPHQDGLAGLLSVAPTFLVYLLSFTFTGIYWINHHHLVHRVEQADHRVLYSNLAFLFSLSLLPFFTSFLIEKKADSFSVALYASSMVFDGFTFLMLRLAIGRLLKLDSKLEKEDVATRIKHYLSLALYLIAIPLARFHSQIALGVVALVTIVWIYPTAHVEPCPDPTSPDQNQLA